MVIKMDLQNHESNRKRSEGNTFCYGQPNVDVQDFFPEKKSKKLTRSRSFQNQHLWLFRQITTLHIVDSNEL